MADIAVVYLARAAEGFAPFERFFASYRDLSAGIEHDLVLIYKGFRQAGEFAAFAALVDGIPHRVIEVNDDIGVDLHAYRVAASQIGHRYVCFLNTFTVLKTEGWLEKLHRNLCAGNVGLVGATGSYESLLSSYEVISQVSWLFNYPTRYDDDLISRFKWLFNYPNGPNSPPLRRMYGRARRWLGDLLRRRPPTERVLDEARGAWTTFIAPGGAYQWLSGFPPFPNPHLRSNVFMVAREDFLRVRLSGAPKFTACAAESGLDGLSNSIRRSGRDILVVGADGHGYPIADWPRSGCFRSGTQANLLATDNQTNAWHAVSARERETLSILSWGGYAPGTARPEILGVSFAATGALDAVPPAAAAAAAAAGPSGRTRLFSIVIPTHNRLALTLEAIRTVAAQDQLNWEVVVFDNASREPVAEAVRDLGDPRIRSERSDDFLPVTASWNRALDLARGDYVTLIGDDDGLLPGFFSRVAELADRFDEPEVIFSSLLQFIHPAVSPENRLGYVRTLPMADFLENRSDAFLLDRETAVTSVNNSLRMRRTFMFNMPAFTARRDFLDRIRHDGVVLHSPFPDYYFANVALDAARSIVAEPRFLAFQGVSKVSFGFTLLNNRTEEGFKVLGAADESDPVYHQASAHLLPGPKYNSEYIITMAYVAQRLGDPSRIPDYAGYRRVQILDTIKRSSLRIGWPYRSGEAWVGLTPSEKAWAFVANTLHKLGQAEPRIFGRLFARLDGRWNPWVFRPRPVYLNSGDVTSGPELFSALLHGDWKAPDNLDRRRQELVSRRP